MKVQKSLTLVAVTMIVGAISMPAVAGDFDDGFGPCGDRAATADRLIELAQHLRCDGNYSSDANPGFWPTATPLWEKRGSADYGCDVHASLAEKLFLAPEPGQNPKKPQGEPTGAAQKVIEEKDDDALQKLVQFGTAVDKSKLNSDLPEAGPIVSDLVGIVEEAKVCVSQL
jgi:hypothetical protein